MGEGNVIGARTWNCWWERRGCVALPAPGGVAGTHKVPNDERWHEKELQALNSGNVRSFDGD